jgi:hypothetical protein
MVWQIISLYADVNIFQSPYEHCGVIYSCHINSPTNHDYSPAGSKSGRTGETCHCLDCGVAWGVAWGVANRITPLRQQSTSYLRKRALQATLAILPDIERPSDPHPYTTVHAFQTRGRHARLRYRCVDLHSRDRALAPYVRRRRETGFARPAVGKVEYA